MSVVKLVHISSSKVFWSKVIVKMFTEYVYYYFENNSSKQTLKHGNENWIPAGKDKLFLMLNTYPKS